LHSEFPINRLAAVAATAENSEHTNGNEKIQVFFDRHISGLTEDERPAVFHHSSGERFYNSSRLRGWRLIAA